MKGLAAAAVGLRVDSCEINGGVNSTAGRRITLDCVVHGRATHYRASEDPAFKDADWRPYEPSPRFRLSAPPGEKTVYYQVRRYSETSGASLQMVSNVADDSIRLTTR